MYKNISKVNFKQLPIIKFALELFSTYNLIMGIRNKDPLKARALNTLDIKQSGSKVDQL